MMGLGEERLGLLMEFANTISVAALEQIEFKLFQLIPLIFDEIPEGAN